MGENLKQAESSDRWITVGLIIFTSYVILLALAAISELFGLGWFDHPLFK